MPTIHYVSVFNKEDTLIPQSDLIDLGYVQNKCPVYNHKQSRTFVATSPIDLVLVSIEVIIKYLALDLSC